MYGLTPDDLELQARARGFADELIPHEQYAEEHDGELPDDVAHRLEARAVELGLTATNIPTELGGRGCSALQQVLVQEQGGRVTNALAWCLTTPPGWWPAVANDHQRETYLRPDHRGPARGVLRHHRGVRRLRRVRPRGHRRPRRRRLRPQRREVARDVLQQGRLRLLPGRADRAASTPASRHCSSPTRTPRASAWSAPRRTPTPSPTTTRSWPSRTSGSPPPS